MQVVVLDHVGIGGGDPGDEAADQISLAGVVGPCGLEDVGRAVRIPHGDQEHAIPPGVRPVVSRSSWRRRRRRTAGRGSRCGRTPPGIALPAAARARAACRARAGVDGRPSRRDAPCSTAAARARPFSARTRYRSAPSPRSSREVMRHVEPPRPVGTRPRADMPQIVQPIGTGSRAGSGCRRGSGSGLGAAPPHRGAPVESAHTETMPGVGPAPEPFVFARGPGRPAPV